MILVIDTQYMENYGSKSSPFWKFKGGSSYKITGVPSGTTKRDADKIAVLAKAKIEYRNDYTQQYILGHCLEQDDWLSDFERYQLEDDGDISFPEPIIQYKDLTFNASLAQG